MNAYEVRQAWCLLQVKLCDPCLSTLKLFVYHARRYTSALLYRLPLSPSSSSVKLNNNFSTKNTIFVRKKLTKN